MATTTANGLVKSWMSAVEAEANQQEREDSLTSRGSESFRQFMPSSFRSGTPPSSESDDDEEEENHLARRKSCAACRGKHRAHTCSLGNRTLDSHLRKLGAEDDSDEDGEYDEQSERASSAFAEQMQDYMRDEAVSQTELGTQIGLRQQQISRWIFGKGTTATRQAVERRVRAWLKKRGVSLSGAGETGAAAAPASGGGRKGGRDRGRKSSKPSLMNGTGGGSGRKKRKESYGSGEKYVVRGGRRARLIDTPAEAYTNHFAHALHKYIKSAGLSQEALGKNTGLRQQQISSYMFQKCSETMHDIVEQTLRRWVVRNRIELPGFTTAELKQPPIPWDASEEERRGTGRAGGVKRKASEPPAASKPAQQRRQAPPSPQPPRRVRCYGLARRPMSKFQAVSCSKDGTSENFLPSGGAFVVPRQVAVPNDPYSHTHKKVGVGGGIIMAHQGGIVPLPVGCRLYSKGGSMKIGATNLLLIPSAPRLTSSGDDVPPLKVADKAKPPAAAADSNSNASAASDSVTPSSEPDDVTDEPLPMDQGGKQPVAPVAAPVAAPAAAPVAAAASAPAISATT